MFKDFEQGLLGSLLVENKSDQGEPGRKFSSDSRKGMDQGVAVM